MIIIIEWIDLPTKYIIIFKENDNVDWKKYMNIVPLKDSDFDYSYKKKYLI